MPAHLHYTLRFRIASFLNRIKEQSSSKESVPVLSDSRTRDGKAARRSREEYRAPSSEMVDERVGQYIAIENTSTSSIRI